MMAAGGQRRRSSATVSRTTKYIEMAMLAQKIRRKIIPVVEKYTELALIAKYAERDGVRRADDRKVARSWPAAAPAAGSLRAGTGQSSASALPKSCAPYRS